ncbi:hypothetical protein KXD93_24525 [Mucilaginibacter sp. BJC16-A38]|uniref:hypothetical protein n=1 Tax=Mucilaginibacter phenanthrenivorans TaxID=1234842 RepID=UPI0021579A34|nr:hypothetical protein [Mucilaginibacter phenanthrenivorans]MCR8560846.1 hypothetical protein [Mucilaginibacter phenanthrenivorans]
MKPLLLIPAFLLLMHTCSAQKKIAAQDAVNHSGQSVMVCDKVYNTLPLGGSNTTLLYLGAENGKFLTVVVKGPENSKFKWHPEKDFKGRNVCVTGTVGDYKGKPAIYVTDVNQIKLDLVDNIVKPKKTF